MRFVDFKRCSFVNFKRYIKETTIYQKAFDWKNNLNMLKYRKGLLGAKSEEKKGDGLNDENNGIYRTPHQMGEYGARTF